jgi:pimeloyl-ACP methyl ester carboxylesterase
MEWIIVLVVIVLGVSAAAWLAQESMIFFPQPVGSTKHLPARASAVEVGATDGARLRGWIVPAAETPAPTVIYFGGNAEEVSWTLSDARWPREWTIVGVNYRGYGTSEGKPGEAALKADALSIYDAIARREDVDAHRIAVFGRSLGTGVAVHVAAERPVTRVVLASPYDSFVALGRKHYPWLPVSLLLRHRFDAAADATRCRMPLLAIVGEYDTIIPADRSRALYDAWAGPKTWLAVPGADHNDLGDAEAFWAGVARFLSEHG